MSDKAFDRRFRFDYTSDKNLRKRLHEEVVKEIQSNSEMHAVIDEEFDQLSRDRELVRQIFPRGTTKVALPCNMQRMILNSQKIFKLNKLSKSDLDPKTVVESIRELTKKLVIVSGEDRLSREAQENATMLFNIHLRSTMCSKRVIEEYFLNTEAFR